MCSRVHGAVAGHDVGPWLVSAVVVMFAVIAGALLLLHLEVRHLSAVESGNPLAPYVVTWTLSPYGPPPTR